ncbi:MAG: FAD-binding protein, partial [Hoeflea sp.]|nr:FAD-binding protein [Hoeflea sp.]
MPPPSTLSLWDETAEESDFRSPLTGDVTTDVAIVGGGYTGLSTGLYAAERGLDCCVVASIEIF